MDDRLSAFLDGDRPDDVALFLATTSVDGLSGLNGTVVEDGIVVVVDGERGREAFRAATGTDAMTFAMAASDRSGEIRHDLAGGTCPDGADGSTDTADFTGESEHDVHLVFAFAESQNEDVGGIYTEGDVIHAYARCECGTAFSNRWVVGSR